MSEYIQHFREVKNRCYSSRITEKEAVDLAVLGLAKPIKDLAFQLEFTSLAHLVQKLTAYEHYHPELYVSSAPGGEAYADASSLLAVEKQGARALLGHRRRHLPPTTT